MKDQGEDIAVAVTAIKKAEAEIKKEERERREANRVKAKINVKATYAETGDAQVDEIFKRYVEFYEPVFIKARYKPPYRKYREGYLVRLKRGVADDDRRKIISAGSLVVEPAYNGVAARLFNVHAVSSLIRNQGNVYLEFQPNDHGLFGLAAAVAMYYDDERMLNEVILLLVARSMQLEVGDIDLAGYDDIVERCYKTLVANDDRLVNRHLLLAGPPGCGKSMIAKRLIEKTPDWLHFNISVEANWQECIPTLNEIVKRCNKRLLIIMDEIDEIGLNRDVSRDKVYQLLRLLDGVGNLRHVKFLATTNRPGDLDVALLRPGRLGPVFVVDRPTPEQFTTIVKYYDEKYDAGIDIAQIVQYRDGLTGCDIRTAFEDCIIFGKKITTDNIISNLDTAKKAKEIQGMIYA